MNENTVDKVIATYIRLRDKKAELERRHEEDLAKVAAAMERCAEWLNKYLTEEKLENAKTAEGTAFFKTKDRVSIADQLAFREYVKTTGQIELYEQRPSKTAIKALMEQQRDGTFLNPPPPGVSYVAWREIEIHRPKS